MSYHLCIVYLGYYVYIYIYISFIPVYGCPIFDQECVRDRDYVGGMGSGMSIGESICIGIICTHVLLELLWFAYIVCHIVAGCFFLLRATYIVHTLLFVCM